MANDLRCPQCGSTMDTLRQGEVQIDVCVACGSRWFDRTELAAIVSQSTPGAVLGWGERIEDDEPLPTCPRCRTSTLVPHSYGPSKFRRCSTCRGVSVSSQDLDAVLRAVGGPGSRLAEIVKEMFGA